MLINRSIWFAKPSLFRGQSFIAQTFNSHCLTMTTTFFGKAFWVTVALVSIARLPMIESGSIYQRPDYSEERLAGYRFGDEYFKDRSDENERTNENSQIPGNEAAAATNRADGCERVVKDSMICMLCDDPKTHSKYEQCSYVSRPHENIQSYASSKSYSGRPAASSQRDNQRAEREEQSSGEQRNNDEASGEKTSQQEESSDERPSRYYSSDDGDDDDEGKTYRDEYYGDASKYEKQQQPSESSYESPDRRAHLAKTSKPNCHQVQKDSMTCTICKDPENGGNFEKCSYTHQPNDKLYKYSKSKSFGYPAESDIARETKRVDKIADPPATNNNNHRQQCQRFRKNSSTTCNICRDAVTGEKFEECQYNLKPEHAERHISRNAR